MSKVRHEQGVAHRGVNVIVHSIISNNKQNVQSSCNGQERHESTEQDYEHYITCIDVAVRNGGVGFLFPVGSTFFLLVVIRSYYRPKTFMVNQA